MKKLIIILLLFVFSTSLSLSQAKDKKKNNKSKDAHRDQQQTNFSYAYFGGGCFWCVEAMFEDLNGVKQVQSGYSGGFVQNPEYHDVKTGKTGHAQVIKITYDPTIISFKQLIYIFMHAHDPTTYHQQGIDQGSQYRSVIYYQNDEELRITKSLLKQIENEGTYTGYPQPILTQVAYFGKFYPAETNHQNYYTQNPYEQQCSSVIAPKVSKIKKMFKNYYDKGL